ncbi:MAG: D-2-hydroxyacid dehydrogenase [Opitutales bacterium]|nr:D-2-hydroxyacid dehydrogenase [Opitutales bacterium]
MKELVVLDAGTLRFPQEKWKPLGSLVDKMTLHENTARDPDAIVAAVGDAEVVLSNKVPMSRAVIDRLPKLKLISVLATGYNIFDLEGARENGVTICNVPGYSSTSVAQHTLALMLGLANQVGSHSASVQGGEWVRSPLFSYWLHEFPEFSGKTAGLIGWGDIGFQVGTVLNALGMKVQVHTRTERNAPDWDGFRFVDLDTLTQTSDVISLHCPLTEQTRNMFDEKRLRQMKPTAYLINTARGGLIDESALAKVLRAGHLGGAGLDVLEQEPMIQGHPLIGTPRLRITPHIAWATTESRQRLLDASVENVRRYLAGKPQHVVSG